MSDAGRPPERLVVIGAGQREMVLLRDEAGEPVRTLIERDRAGRWCRPWYGFVWVPAGEPS